MSIIEQIKIAAQKLAQRRGISEAAAYAENSTEQPIVVLNGDGGKGRQWDCGHDWIAER
jgi:hypothetical protein